MSELKFQKNIVVKW